MKKSRKNNRARKRDLALERANCHALLKDPAWYAVIADALKIPRSSCHFSMLSLRQLRYAKKILYQLNSKKEEQK